MIDFELIRRQPDVVKKALTDRFVDTAVIDQLRTVDEEWRAAVGQAEVLQAERNTLTKTKESSEQHRQRLQEIKAKLDSLKVDSAALELKRRELYLTIPNIPAADVPVGDGETANTVLETIGEPKTKTGRPHEELMAQADWLDLETAASAAGSRFRYLKNDAAVAHFRLMWLAFDRAIEAGFTPIIPPVLARSETLERSGWFPDGRNDAFQVGDSHFLTGTSESLLVALGASKDYAQTELPQRFVGFSSCFRKEVGSYGKDVKGMFRQHQFDKVELVVFCRPEDSESEHQKLVALQRQLVESLGLPYQVVLIGSADLGATAAKKIDIEAWFPSQGRYRETHSASNCTDYQARRFGLKNTHTLNATLATERLLLSVIENNQDTDGRVTLPAELRRGV